MHPASAAVGTCTRCGSFMCELCRAGDGQRCPTCALRVRSGASERPWLWSWVSGAVPLVVSAGMHTGLAYLRPDLEGPMLDHLFGLLLLAVGPLLSLLTVGFTRLALSSRSVGVRVVVVALLQLAMNFVVVFVALFGPIVFAFMFGGETGP